jgi:hypothetical protein
MGQIFRGGYGDAEATRLTTREVTAIKGAFEAGAISVTVNNSHGTMDNLIQAEPHRRARLIAGSPKAIRRRAVRQLPPGDRQRRRPDPHRVESLRRRDAQRRTDLRSRYQHALRADPRRTELGPHRQFLDQELEVVSPGRATTVDSGAGRRDAEGRRKCSRGTCTDVFPRPARHDRGRPAARRATPLRLAVHGTAVSRLGAEPGQHSPDRDRARADRLGRVNVSTGQTASLISALYLASASA